MDRAQKTEQVKDIRSRFDRRPNAGVSDISRWGISNSLGVDFHTYSHPDQALMTTAMRELGASICWSWKRSARGSSTTRPRRRRRGPQATTKS